MGGVKHSGVGREFGQEGLEPFVELKSIGIPQQAADLLPDPGIHPGSSPPGAPVGACWRRVGTRLAAQATAAPAVDLHLRQHIACVVSRVCYWSLRHEGPVCTPVPPISVKDVAVTAPRELASWFVRRTSAAQNSTRSSN